MKAVITVRAVQNLQDSGDDEIEFVTDGVYTKIPEGYAVKYAESELTGMEGTATTVEILPDRVCVTRRGNMNMSMEFKEGQKCDFLYNTMFGTATLSIKTNKIQSNLGDRGGSLNIDYVVNMEHAVVAINKLKISVKQR